MRTQDCSPFLVESTYVKGIIRDLIPRTDSVIPTLHVVFVRDNGYLRPDYVEACMSEGQNDGDAARYAGRLGRRGLMLPASGAWYCK